MISIIFLSLAGLVRCAETDLYNRVPRKASLLLTPAGGSAGAVSETPFVQRLDLRVSPTNTACRVTVALNIGFFPEPDAGFAGNDSSGVPSNFSSNSAGSNATWGNYSFPEGVLAAARIDPIEDTPADDALLGAFSSAIGIRAGEIAVLVPGHRESWTIEGSPGSTGPGAPAAGRFVVTVFAVLPHAAVSVETRAVFQDTVGSVVGGVAVLCVALLTALVVFYVRFKTRRIRVKRKELLGDVEMAGVSNAAASATTADRPDSMLELLDRANAALRRRHRDRSKSEKKKGLKKESEKGKEKDDEGDESNNTNNNNNNNTGEGGEPANRV